MAGTTELRESVWPVETLERATWAFVVVGVAVRLFRYAMNFPLWGDEAALAANFVSRDYRTLLAPLEFYQVAPPLFLWVELTAVKLFGFSEASLRLFPICCGVASLFLMRRVASRLSGGLPMLLAVGFLAVAPHPIRHSAEVKPYASDLLVALGLLSLAVDWWKRPERSTPLWCLAVASPLAIAVSHPAVFVAAAIGLTLAIPAWKTGRRNVRLGAASALSSPALSFIGLFLLVTASQCDGGGLRGMRDYWADSFPPIDQPLALVRWLIATHTGSMMAYPEGGPRGESTATALLCAIAVFTLWKSRRRTILALLVAPFGLTLIAATLRRYPYGGEARIAQHLAPMICLLAALGAAALLRALPRPEDSSRGLALVLFGLLALATGSMTRDRITPYRTEYEHRAREFARWFWIEKSRDAELACARLDFAVIEPRPLHFATAVYVCNREIYRPRATIHPRVDHVTAEHPLRCAVFDADPLANPSFVALRDTIAATLPLRSVERFVHGAPTAPRKLVVTVFEFAPPTAHPGPVLTREIRWPREDPQIAADPRQVR